MTIPTRSIHSLACGFDLNNLCDSHKENEGALRALLGLKQVLLLSKDPFLVSCAQAVEQYINWARTGERPKYFSNEIV